MKNFFTHKLREKSPGEIVGIIIFGGIIITGLAILLGYVIMWLWNWLMPELFGFTTITFWQAAGLFVLLKILFGGCGGSSKKSSKSSSKNNSDSKSDFSKWKHYDKFWEEEGDELYQQYIKRVTQPTQNEANTETDNLA